MDASPTLLAAAAAAHPEGRYLVAAADRLPFPDGAFDLVVAHNVLMDVDDMPAAVAEAARVLAPGGRLCVAVTHPLADAGRWAGSAADAPFVIHGSYLAAGDLAVTVERDGLTMHFAGRTYPLEAYARALEAAEPGDRMPARAGRAAGQARRRALVAHPAVPAPARRASRVGAV